MSRPAGPPPLNIRRPVGTVPRWDMTFEVTADLMADVRDLAHEVRLAIEAAQRQGRHPDVALAGGPTIIYVGQEE